MPKQTPPKENDHDLLIRLDEKVDTLTGEIRHYSNSAAETLKNHEARINGLEQESEVKKGIALNKKDFRKELYGSLTVLALILTAIITWLVSKGH